MTLVAGLFLTAALGHGPTISDQSASSGITQSEECGMPEGWDKVAAREPRYVVLGELHGTQQGPEFIGNLACALGAKGEHILIAVEKSATDDRELQTVWRLPASQFDRSLAGIGWLGRNDGVASEAMFALLVRLHNLKESGVPISVVAFNGIKDEVQSNRFADLSGQGPHEAAQAENIAQAADLADYDRVLVLVGNFHARKASAVRQGAEFEPMAKRLARYGKTITLDMRYAEGSSWNCVLKPGVKVEPEKPLTDDSLDCGNHPTRGSLDLHRSPFIELDPASADDAISDYDGFFWVGPINGSPPMAPK